MTTKECQVEGTMAFAQRSAVEAALRDNHCNLSHAARQLRVGRTTLYRLIKRFEIEVDVMPRQPAARAARRATAPTSVRLIDGVWYLVGGDGDRG
ncbi:helix-turn-helix domain-containing protein [Sphingomonas sp. RHCKR7]|uniref:helix-turn-helix domain-containing protein n=1 Tax=Sphingomonas folli TaxID=2862497 RepID=UPI001CA52D2D|nr:helix-turn-helix domain-containing protein [Sphingomonas folli]MBW6526360.1 helix-turn-helix domain-containing protein [Sphingomonas folli]